MFVHVIGRQTDFSARRRIADGIVQKDCEHLCDALTVTYAVGECIFGEGGADLDIFEAAIFSKASQAFSTSVSSWVRTGLMSRCPVSQLSSVSMSFNSLEVRSASFLIVLNSGHTSLSSPASAHESITASGVRSSWDAEAMN